MRVTAPGCPSLVFPVDIRDFSGEPQAQPGDYCFANLWLEDTSLQGWQAHLPQWAAYMAGFTSKHIVITHLYEDGRPDDKMWRAEHAEAAARALADRDRNLQIRIPQRGEVLVL